MATISHRQQTGSTLTPPPSSHSDYNPWSHAVPMHNEVCKRMFMCLIESFDL